MTTLGMGRALIELAPRVSHECWSRAVGNDVNDGSPRADPATAIGGPSEQVGTGEITPLAGE
jgi:hypothetical protein